MGRMVPLGLPKFKIGFADFFSFLGEQNAFLIIGFYQLGKSYKISKHERPLSFRQKTFSQLLLL